MLSVLENCLQFSCSNILLVFSDFCSDNIVMRERSEVKPTSKDTRTEGLVLRRSH